MKLSKAYAAGLDSPIPLDVMDKLGLEQQVTWAEAIAHQALHASLGLTKEGTKFVVEIVIELRETTEGKNVEKSVSSIETNPELKALADAIAAGPVEPEEPEGSPAA